MKKFALLALLIVGSEANAQTPYMLIPSYSAPGTQFTYPELIKYTNHVTGATSWRYGQWVFQEGLGRYDLYVYCPNRGGWPTVPGDFHSGDILNMCDPGHVHLWNATVVATVFFHPQYGGFNTYPYLVYFPYGP